MSCANNGIATDNAIGSFKGARIVSNIRRANARAPRAAPGRAPLPAHSEQGTCRRMTHIGHGIFRVIRPASVFFVLQKIYVYTGMS